ncbi:MAG: TetR/AcrR family transcriptional regulator [Thermodesulfobacteriota bacterium]
MSSTKRTEVRRGQIVKAAKAVFAEKGYQEATISEIARRAGLSEPTLYEYFSSKEEMLFSIPVETSLESGRMMGRHLEMVKGAANRLRGLIYTLCRIFQTDQDYAAVSYLILKQNRKFIETEEYDIMRRNLRPLLQVIEEGIASGEFTDRFTPFFVRSVILGALEHLIIRKLLMGTDDNLLDYVDPLLDLVIRGISRPNEDERYSFRITIERDVNSLEIGAKPPVTDAVGKAAARDRKKVKKVSTSTGPSGLKSS